MKVTYCSTKDQIEELKNDSALTIIGLIADEENLNAFVGWVKTFTPMKNESVYVISGKLMNDSYNLEGNKRYKDDLNIVSIKLSDMQNPMSIVIKRFEIGGRWMDDIIANNEM